MEYLTIEKKKELQPKIDVELLNTKGGWDRYSLRLTSNVIELKRPLNDNYLYLIKQDANGYHQMFRVEKGSVGSGIIDELRCP